MPKLTKELSVTYVRMDGPTLIIEKPRTQKVDIFGLHVLFIDKTSISSMHCKITIPFEIFLTVFYF